MGRPCKCCKQCEEVILTCAEDGDNVVADIQNATEAWYRYRIRYEHDPLLNIIWSDNIDIPLTNGSASVSIPESSVLDEYGNYYVEFTAKNACGTKTCVVSCVGNLVCYIVITDYIDDQDRPDDCSDYLTIRWWIEGPWNKLENTTAYLNGEIVNSDYNGFVLQGRKDINRCAAADEYVMTVQDNFCGSFQNGDCIAIPNCVDKKSHWIVEIQGVSDYTNTYTLYSTTWNPWVNNGTCETRTTVNSITYEGLSAINGTYIFSRCFEKRSPIFAGTGRYIVVQYGETTIQNIEWYVNHRGQIYFKIEGVPIVGVPTSLLGIAYPCTQYAQNGDILYDPDTGYIVDRYWYRVYHDIRSLPIDFSPLIDFPVDDPTSHTHRRLKCNAEQTPAYDGAGNIISLGEEDDGHPTCCTPICYDGYDDLAQPIFYNYFKYGDVITYDVGGDSYGVVSIRECISSIPDNPPIGEWTCQSSYDRNGQEYFRRCSWGEGASFFGQVRGYYDCL